MADQESERLLAESKAEEAAFMADAFYARLSVRTRNVVRNHYRWDETYSEGSVLKKLRHMVKVHVPGLGKKGRQEIISVIGDLLPDSDEAQKAGTPNTASAIQDIDRALVLMDQAMKAMREAKAKYALGQ